MFDMRAMCLLVVTMGCATATNQPANEPTTTADTSPGSTPGDGLPRTGGGSQGEAEVIEGTIPVTVEGVIEPGQTLWYRLDPPIAASQRTALVNQTRLVLDEPYGATQHKAQGRIDYLRGDIKEETYADFWPRLTTADGGFTEDKTVAYLKGDVVFLKVSLAPETVAPVHFKASIQRW